MRAPTRRALSVLALTGLLTGSGVVRHAGASTSSGDRAIFEPLVPARILDTRDGTGTGGVVGQLGGTPLILTVRGAGGVPADATAVVLNLTVTKGTAKSWLTVWPSDVAMPTTSAINWAAGQTVANMVTLTVSAASGQISLKNANGLVDVVADVAGFYHGHDHDDRYYTKAQIDAKLPPTVRVNIPAVAFEATGADQRVDATGCMRNTTLSGFLYAPVQIPVGVTITAFSAYFYDSDVSSGTLSLFRVTTNYLQLAQAVSSGVGGLQTVTITLPTPEPVDEGDFFLVRYQAGNNTTGLQICGVGISYTPGT